MKRLLKTFLLLPFMAALATPLNAATWNWVGGDPASPQDFNDILNWTGGSGAFAAGNNVVVNGIDNTGNYPILSALPSVGLGSIQVGNGAAGYMSQTGGSVNCGFGVANQGTAGTSTYDMSGGTLTSAGGAYIGYGTSETGVVNLSGTAQMNLGSGLLWIGRIASGGTSESAAASITVGRLAVLNTNDIAIIGNGALASIALQDNGTYNANATMYIGCTEADTIAGSASITMSGFSVFNHTAGDMQLANAGTATMTMTGNAQFNDTSTSGRFSLGTPTDNAQGHNLVSVGTLTVGTLGGSDNPTFTISAGTNAVIGDAGSRVVVNVNTGTFNGNSTGYTGMG